METRLFRIFSRPHYKMSSIPFLTKLNSSTPSDKLSCTAPTNHHQISPVQFALSNLSKSTDDNNLNIYSSRYKPRYKLEFTGSQRSQETAKTSTVSLVERRKQKGKTNLSKIVTPENEKLVSRAPNYASLGVCLESRPPLKIDLSGPKPTTYDPPTFLPWETTSPSFTMRPKTQPEKDSGGDRVAWNKQWFASHDIWTYRAHFDQRYPWPSPAHYISKGTVGETQSCLPQSPSHSMGKRKTTVFSKKDSENEPSPNQYKYSSAKLKVMKMFPSFTMQGGRKGGTTIWSDREPVPGPGSYNPRYYRSSSMRCAPCFSISRGVREIGITRNCTL